MLEQRYRRLLRILPAGYRDAWQEEMVTTFLASMRTDDPEQAEYLADFGRPSWGEMASVVALAIRLRLPGWRLKLGGPGAPPRSVLCGDAIRLVALSALLVIAVGAPTTLTTLLWLIGRSSWVPWLLPGSTIDNPALLTPWYRFASNASLLWLLAYLAVLVGQRRIAQLLAVLAALLVDITLLANPGAPVSVSRLAYAAANLLPVLALAAFRRDTPRPRYRPWLLALFIGIGLQAGLLALTAPHDLHTFALLDWPATCCLALVCAAVVHLAAAGSGRHAAPPWSLALAVLAAATLGLRTLTLAGSVMEAPAAQHRILLTLGIVEVCATLAVAVPLVVLASRALRRLPSTTPAGDPA